VSSLFAVYLYFVGNFADVFGILAVGANKLSDGHILS
jgi:hypothetical protein